VDNSAAERIYVMFLLLFSSCVSAAFSAVAAASVLIFPFC